MYEANRKVAMIGPPGVGKTSIVSRLISGQFDDAYIPTIDSLSEYTCIIQGCKFHLKIGDYPGQVYLALFMIFRTNSQVYPDQ